MSSTGHSDCGSAATSPPPGDNAERSLYGRAFEIGKEWFNRIDLGFARKHDGSADFSRQPPESFAQMSTVQRIVRQRRPTTIVHLVLVVFQVAFQRFRVSLVAAIILSLVASLAGILKPKMLQLMMDHAAQLAASDVAIVPPAGWSSHILLLLLALVALSWLQALLQQLVTGIITFVATQTEDMWAYAGLAHFYSLPMAWHNERDSASITSKISSGAGSVWFMLYEVVGEEVLINSFTVTMILASAIWTAPHLWWVFLLPLPVYVVLLQQADSLLRIEQKKCRKASRAADDALYDGTTNKQVAKAFGRELFETRRYANYWSSYHVLEYTETFIYTLRNLLQKSSEVVLHGLLVYMCIDELMAGTMSLGTVSMLIAYQQMIFEPLTSFNRMFLHITRDMRKLDDLVKLLLIDDPLQDRPDAVELPALREGIYLRNVSFKYGAAETETEPKTVAETKTATKAELKTEETVTIEAPRRKPAASAVSQINISIPAGKTTAIVGRSGAGKSTLLQLLLRFYDVSEGEICWDSIDLRASTRASLRARTAVVQQDCSLFSRTIRENIAYGSSDISFEQVVDAAKQANIHDYIMSLPEAYESMVGERGVRLSGGQRQRIAIARALVMQPSLLIFDESTSSLDSESERAIQAAIESLQHHVTQVIVAHRLSTILHADQIIVMDHGTVVAADTHERLLQTCPTYQSLYHLQHTSPHGDATQTESDSE